MASRYCFDFGRVRDMKKRYYIAYGSNLNIQQMQMRCPYAAVLGTAELDGWELLFKGSKTSPSRSAKAARFPLPYGR